MEAPGQQGASEEPECYNCGLTGHWMMSCPEPTRERPAGLEKARSKERGHARSARRGRPSHDKRDSRAVITRYAPPLPHAPPAPGYGLPLPPHLHVHTPQPTVFPPGPPPPPVAPLPPPPPQAFAQPYQQYQSYSTLPTGASPTPPPLYGSYSSANAVPPPPPPPPSYHPQPPYAPPAYSHTQAPYQAEPPTTYIAGNNLNLHGSPPYPHGSYPPRREGFLPKGPPPHQAHPPSLGYPPPSEHPLPPIPPPPAAVQPASFSTPERIGHGGVIGAAHHSPGLHRSWPQPSLSTTPGDAHNARQRRGRHDKHDRKRQKHSSQRGDGKKNKDRDESAPAEDGSRGAVPAKEVSAESENVTDSIAETDGGDWNVESETDMEVIFPEVPCRPFDPVGIPLPSKHSDAPTIPPAYNAACIKSKFVREGNVAEFSRPLQASSYWASVAGDPAFKKFADMVERSFPEHPFTYFSHEAGPRPPWPANPKFPSRFQVPREKQAISRSSSAGASGKKVDGVGPMDRYHINRQDSDFGGQSVDHRPAVHSAKRSCDDDRWLHNEKLSKRSRAQYADTGPAHGSSKGAGKSNRRQLADGESHRRQAPGHTRDSQRPSFHDHRDRSKSSDRDHDMRHWKGSPDPVTRRYTRETKTQSPRRSTSRQRGSEQRHASRGPYSRPGSSGASSSADQMTRRASTHSYQSNGSGSRSPLTALEAGLLGCYYEDDDAEVTKKKTTKKKPAKQAKAKQSTISFGRRW